ncbi:MAG: MoaD/ThiS family protein [Xanthomonadales bacterium]|nr:MoaD/ThiS family protein [Xanthomonadales bacterium]
MNKLVVRYFAVYRESTGLGEESVTSAAATPEALFAESARRYPGLERFEAARVAINDELASWDSPLSDGDTVLFFPPVAGG